MDCSIHILLEGVPVSSNRGTLGWCSVTLLACGEKKILFDTGSYSDRRILVDKLSSMSVKPDDIEIIVTSHFHYDHILNAEIFEKSRILVSEREYQYVSKREYEMVKDPFVPISHFISLKDRIDLVKDGEEILEGIKTIMLPGHTPGSIGLLLEEKRVLIAGDAVKNAWEFSKDIVMSHFDSKEHALESYRKVRSCADIVIPGHDLPFEPTDTENVKYTKLREEVTFIVWPDPKKKEVNISLFE